MRSPEIVRRAERATMRPLWMTKRPRRPPDTAPGDHAAPSVTRAASRICPIAKGNSKDIALVMPRVATAAVRGTASGRASSIKRRSVTRSSCDGGSSGAPSFRAAPLACFDVSRRIICHVDSLASTTSEAGAGGAGGSADNVSFVAVDSLATAGCCAGAPDDEAAEPALRARTDAQVGSAGRRV